MKTKKILAALLALSMVLTLVAVPVFADEPVAEVDGQTYTSIEDAANAVQSGGTLKILAETLSKADCATLVSKIASKNVTVLGQGQENTTLNYSCTSITDTNIKFKDLTFVILDKPNDTGSAINADFDTATIKGEMTIMHRICKFDKCTFDADGKSGIYPLWLYSHGAELTDCRFVHNTEKAHIKMYAEGGNMLTLTAKNCVFEGKPGSKKCNILVSNLNNGYTSPTRNTDPNKLTYDLTLEDCTSEYTDLYKKEGEGSTVAWDEDCPDFELNVPVNLTVYKEGKQIYPEVETKAVAKIGTDEYETLQKALADAKANDTITLISDITLDELVTISKSDITIDGAGYKIIADPNKADWQEYLNSSLGKVNLLSVSGSNVTVKNLTVSVSNYRGMSCMTTKGGSNILYENNTLTGRGSGHYYGYANNGTITFKDCNITTHGYAIHLANEGGVKGDKVVIDNCKVYGWSSFGTCESVTAKDSYFGMTEDTGRNGNLAVFRPYCPTTLTNCTFSKEYTMCTGKSGDYFFIGLGTGAPTTVVLNKCSVEGEGTKLTDIVTENAFDNAEAYEGSVIAFDPVGDATNGYTGGTFVTSNSANIKVAEGDYELKNIEGNVYVIEAKPDVEVTIDKNTEIKDADEQTIVPTEQDEKALDDISKNEAVNNFSAGVSAAVEKMEEKNPGATLQLLKDSTDDTEIKEALDKAEKIESKVLIDLKAIVKTTVGGTDLFSRTEYDVSPVVKTTIIVGGQEKEVKATLKKVEVPISFRLGADSRIPVGTLVRKYHGNEFIGNGVVEEEKGGKFVKFENCTDFSPYAFEITDDLEWKYGCDSGSYGEEGSKKGVARFLFDSGLDDSVVTEAKVVFFNFAATSDDENSGITVRKTDGGCGAFSADLYGLDINKENTIFAMAYVSTANAFVWSDINEGYTPAFEKKLSTYDEEGGKNQ